MTPGKLNLTCPQGATFSKTLIFKINDVPVDTTGWVARMQARETHMSKTYVLNLTTENSGIALDDQGNISITIDAATSAAIKAKKYVYDLELESNDGTVYRLIEGAFLVTPEVTR